MTGAVTIASSAAGRVAQFIRLLGSDQPGEIIAAAGALRRTLDGAGSVKAITAPPPPSVGPSEIEVMIRFCLRQGHALNDRERQFIHDLDCRLRRFGNRPLSPKQQAWLLAIVERLRQ
jgi:hypothetical protein